MNVGDQGQVRAGQRVPVNGGGGAAWGVRAVQLAKALGAEVTVIDAPARLDLLRALGAVHIIDVSHTPEPTTSSHSP